MVTLQRTVIGEWSAMTGLDKAFLWMGLNRSVCHWPFYLISIPTYFATVFSDALIIAGIKRKGQPYPLGRPDANESLSTELEAAAAKFIELSRKRRQLLSNEVKLLNLLGSVSTLI